MPCPSWSRPLRPGLREGGDWLADLRRPSLLEALLADGAIAAAARARHGHKLDRALNADVTALCLAAGALFPALGYDGVLALVFGMPGVPVRPGAAVPAGAACTRARARHGEARAMSEAGAARAGIPAGPDGTAFGMEITQLDGTTLEMAANPALAAASGVPRAGTRPLLRLAELLCRGTRRWIAAAVSGCHDSGNALAGELTPYFRKGQLNLAGRGLFAMCRWITLPATGAHLLWRARSGAKPVPYRTMEILPDGRNWC